MAEPVAAEPGMTPPPFPTSAVADTEAAAAPKPVGPHGQHDPHSTLDPERLIRVALQHESEGRLELALKTLAEGIDKFPNSAELYAVRGSLRLQMQQVSAALSDLEKAAQLDPQDAMIRVNRAQAYRSFGRYDEAMKDLDIAVEGDPNLLPARFNRGALLYAGGDFEGALLDFDQCIAIDPHASAPYFNRGSTYWELSRSDEAMADMERFIELADSDEWKQVAGDLLKNWKIALEAEAKAAKSGS
ncbi:MAG: tetratricopeptide repeat protein [Sedimenticolaceae bacterium]|jgi:tetratricopeptide (TPR) repeat protein